MKITDIKNRPLINESLLMEDPIYRNFKQVGRYIAERRMSEKEILQIFADVETGMTNTATGANRTMLGRGKDQATDLAARIRKELGTILGNIQDSVPVSAVDTAYDQATDALAGLAGGQKGQVMQAIKKYRMLVKKYPKSAGFAKAALVAITGLATGGAGLPAIAGLTYALDAAVKGEKLSSVLGKGAGAAALAWAGQAIAGMVGSSADTGQSFTTAGPDPVSNLVSPDKFPTADLPTYTVQSGDNLSKIAQANNVSVGELRGLNPQLADASGATGGQLQNVDVLKPGQQITLPPESGSGTYAGGVGTSAGTQADIASGQVPNSEISRRLAGDVGATPSAGPAVQPATSSSPVAAATGDVASQAGSAASQALRQEVQTIALKAAQDAIASGIDPSQTNRIAGEVYGAISQYGSASGGKLSQMSIDGIARKAAIIAGGIKESRKLPGSRFGQRMTQVRESVQIKKLPLNQLRDQASTKLLRSLHESRGQDSRSFMLTDLGVNTIFENIDRHRRAIIKELTGVPGSTRPAQYRPDAPDAAPPPAAKPGMFSRGLSRVGSALSTFGRQFTTKVTKERLKMNWHQKGKPSDSTQLAAWMVTQGVPEDIVASVYKKMGIPYSAPAAAASTSVAPSPYGKGDPEQTKVTAAKMSNEKLQSFISRATDPANPHVQIAKAELAKRQAGGGSSRTTGASTGGSSGSAASVAPAGGGGKIYDAISRNIAAIDDQEKQDIISLLQSTLPKAPAAKRKSTTTKTRRRSRTTAAPTPATPTPVTESQGTCPKCGGPAFTNLVLAEKQDACYHKVRSRYKVWPSAYASGALVQCRKKGAKNWGTKS